MSEIDLALPVLNIENVSKRYATYNSLFKRALSWFDFESEASSEFWAVKDVSLSLKSGEAIAIIGQNGAGKSTLLKMVTGTVRPSAGSINMHGRVSALLELGFGFNPEFSGRQNCYFAGGLMGLSTLEIEALIPGIEEFAELGEFFDKPLRIYSSGMGARLAFSVATAVRPDLLIVDEILAVGDSYFQHKSFARIREFKEQGTAIILVTHGLGDVRSLCERVILLDKGHVLKDGPPDEVVDFYNALIAAKENEKLNIEQRRIKGGWLHTKSGTKQAYATSVTLVDAETDAPVSTALLGQKLILKIEAQCQEALESLVLGLMIKDPKGHVVWGTNTWHTKQIITDVKAGETVVFTCPFTCTLGPGSYGLVYALTNSDTHLSANYEWSDNTIVFDVLNANREFFIGSSMLDLNFIATRQS